MSWLDVGSTILVLALIGAGMVLGFAATVMAAAAAREDVAREAYAKGRADERAGVRP